MITDRSLMWFYQADFQTSVEVEAKSIFNKLDKNLDPNVYLVGVLYEDSQEGDPVCIEPEDYGYDPNLFANVKDMAKSLEREDGEREIATDDPIGLRNYKRRRELKALKESIQRVIKQGDGQRGLVSFCSWPVFVQGYMVSTLLHLNRKSFDSLYSLLENQADENIDITTSLLDAVIIEFLDGCSEALRKSDPGSEFRVLGRNSDEIIRSAGNNLMHTPDHAAARKEGIHGLFYACNSISSLRYEGADSIGKMLIAKRGHPNIEVTLALTSPVRMLDHRAVRKLLEISSDEVSLLSDSAFIYGLGKIIGSYEKGSEDLFIVNFTQHHTWELVHADQVMMRVLYGQPQLPRKPIDEEKFKRDILRIFGEIDSTRINELWELVVEATNQKHGTMVVISTGAQKEADRLGRQCTKVEPLELTPQIMGLITAIDGAVLIDPNATCFAIGVILDGLASNKGNYSRGARYNSAVRYVESSQYPCLMIVVSEDGFIDLVPDLMPQIPRSEIHRSLSNLRHLRDTKNSNVKQYNRVMSLLSDHRFYLLPEVCDEINSLRREIEVNIEDDDVSSKMSLVVSSDFIPNKEMNDSFFIEDQDDSGS